MNRKQASDAAKRWNGDAETEAREPAGEYDITIIVSNGDAELKINMPGIPRKAIMEPGYQTGIQIAVQNFEHFVYGQPLPDSPALPAQPDKPVK